MAFSIMGTKLYIPAVNLWTQDNASQYNNWNQDLNVQLIGININQK